MNTVRARSKGFERVGDPSQTVQQSLLGKLVKALGGRYSSSLGINLASAESEEIFKWFLASLVLDDNINEDIAARTYTEFERAMVLSPQAIIEASGGGLMDILDRGHYGAYAFKLVTKLSEAAETLQDKYQGDLNRLHFVAKDERVLEVRLRALGKEIAPTTINTFLREMRDFWEKAKPPLSEAALVASENLGLVQAIDAAQGLEELMVIWEENGKAQGRFSDFEIALAKLGKNYCGEKRCSLCPATEECHAMK